MFAVEDDLLVNRGNELLRLESRSARGDGVGSRTKTPVGRATRHNERGKTANVVHGEHD